MKKILLFAILLFFLSGTRAQEINIPAQFPGGDSAWNQYISNAFIKQNMINQTTKKDIERFGNTQRVVYTFAILTDGTIGIINIEGAASQAVRNEIQRVLKNSLRWTAATVNGKPVVYRKKQVSTFTFD